MNIKKLAMVMRYLFKQWFHKRNIIIVSHNRVKHIPISGGVQFGLLLLVASAICWLSYTAGSFMAARSALQAQTQTLRSVASAHIENNFNGLSKPLPLALMKPAAPEPMFTLAAIDRTKLVDRVAFLENRISELQSANAEIIQRVQEKTSGQIEELESIIEQTGLKPTDLKKQAVKEQPVVKVKSVRRHQLTDSQGGPFIPADTMDKPAWKHELYSTLDELALLRQIVSNLPLDMPINHASEQSHFGHRIDPFNSRLAFHSGIDLAGPYGAKVFSTADGQVAAAGYSSTYGNAVDIDHGFGIVTRYGHLSQIKVRAGQKVARGEIIGVQGSTGRSTGQHVHYEVRYNDRPMNPKRFLSAGEYVSKE